MAEKGRRIEQSFQLVPARDGHEPGVGSNRAMLYFRMRDSRVVRFSRAGRLRLRNSARVVLPLLVAPVNTIRNRFCE